MVYLVFFGLLVLLILSLASSRHRRRAEEEEARRRAEAARASQGSGDDGSAGWGGGFSPFGGLFDLLTGGLSRSYAYDEETGQWIDVTDLEPDPVPEPRPQASPASPAPPRPDGGRRTATRPRSSTTTKQGGLFGGMFGGGDGSGSFSVEPPEDLGTFREVGGMEALKQEVRDTVGLVLQHPDDAERYGIEWNGILLHGPPGVGKTFFARAIAGEFGLNMIHVSTGDLVSSLVGGSARNVDKAFETAMQHLPALLFFDEFDSIAQRRDQNPDQESRRTVNQLLTALEANRGERRLLVMAATNSVDHLDPAVIRPGRFDRHIRIDLPDAEARRAIFQAELRDRPVSRGIDLDELVRKTEGMTPAAISKIVDGAALEVFRVASASGRQLELDEEHLLAAIDRSGGQDRPTVERWTWDSLILPPNIKAQLQQLQTVIEDPDAAARFGIEPPTGLLLAGPPGTGKTTVAKVLAAQARCSFYPVSGADVMSKWVGESEQNVRRLFERARENRPSIVFIDEIDALAGRRGTVEVHDTQVNQLLAEIDGLAGQRGVFVIGATNRPDELDPALLRGGRLSRTIVLGLPDAAGREAVLRLHSARMPTVNVDLAAMARDTEGFSPADLNALCQEAGLAAMLRTSGRAGPAPEPTAVIQADFDEALRRLRADRLPQASSY